MSIIGHQSDLLLRLLLLHIPGKNILELKYIKKSYFCQINNLSRVRMPLERRQMPDPLQVRVTELRHMEQRLLLLTAQHGERLSMKVLQQSQLQDKTRHSACLPSEHADEKGTNDR